MKKTNTTKKFIFYSNIIIGNLYFLHTPIANSLDLSQSPPGSTDPYVAPNVIISIDDSGSMQWRLDNDNNNNINETTEPIDGKWPVESRRINVLKHALKTVFKDTELIENGKIRLAWQAMWNGGKSPGVGTETKYSSYTSKGGANNVNSSTSGINSMKVLDDIHRKNFLDFVSNLKWDQNATHSHMLFSQADAYLRRSLDINSPWAAKPGVKAEPYLSCRKNYHIFMTDGRWNGTTSGGNRESTAITLPDGTSYTPDSKQTKIYFDNYKDNLSDWAFYSWSTVLQPTLYSKTDISKQVSTSNVYRNAEPTEKIGSVELNKYWNPKFNPANWPHLVTYTIGFSKAAVTWPGDTTIIAPTQKVPFGYDNSFIKLVEGTHKWPSMDNENKRSLDLWHAAINGRGRFYAVEDGNDLEKAFREIIGTINAQTKPDRSSSAISGTSINNKPVGTYITYNKPEDAWSGGVEAYEINLNGQQAKWGGKTTADILDSREISEDERLILTWNDKKNNGSLFKWSSDETYLSNKQKKFLSLNADGTNDSLGEKRISYIHGDRSNEGNASPLFRKRYSRQADIVNSNIWYTGLAISNYQHEGYVDFVKEIQQKKRKSMVYVGGNDGMLHGFSAEDGKEKIAYIPRAVYPNLAKLSWQNYDDDHHYYVDGSPMTGDIDISNKTNSADSIWKTYLVGTLGAGGKGYFVLDVTDTSSENSGFSKGNAANLVVMDKTFYSNAALVCPENDCETQLEENDDIGHIFSTPTTMEGNPLQSQQISLLNNNRWAVILGNGYNSKNQRPVLLIQYLDGNKELLRLPATTSKQAACTEDDKKNNDYISNFCHNVMDNGLSAPRIVDINGDNRPDIVYAGDIKGNLWKFYIGSKSTEEWGVAFEGSPLYTAVGGTQGSPNTRTMRQPITAPPTIRTNDRAYTTGTGNNLKIHNIGGMMVSFGTGRNVTTTDPANEDVQSMYSVLDNTRYVVAKDPNDKKIYVSIHTGSSDGSVQAPQTVGTGVQSLAQQKIGTTKYIGQDNLKHDFWAMNSSESTKINWSIHKGWYLDFPATGERLLKPMDFLDGSNILAIYSQVPAKGSNIKTGQETCEATTVDAEVQYLTLLNIMDGQAPSVQLMDLTGENTYDLVLDNYVSRQKIERGAHTRLVDGDHIRDISKSEEFKLARMPEQSMRPSWRQLK